MKFRASILFAALLLMGCDHQKKASQAQAEAGSAPVAEEGALTGMPPGQTTASGTNTPPAQAAFPPVATQAATPPAENTSTPPPAQSVAAAPPPEPAPAPTPAPAPDPTPAPVADLPRLHLNPTAPEPATSLPPIGDDSAKQEQVVVLKTTYGKIVIELDNSAAPITCENFRKLVSDGFYNHTVFHRVIPNFIIQGGDPNSKGDNRPSYGQGGPNYRLPAEIKLTHDEGAVAMARLPDSVNPKRLSNGSQFYICLEACPSLDAKYTVFGHVIKGMDVANKIGDQPRDAKDDPNDRIEMDASLEPKSQALSNDGSN